jgi:hypothetical protein
VLVQGVKAASGISMSGTFQSSFTTTLTTNLTTGNTVLTSPTNFATGVPTNAAFMIEFSKQVDPSSLTPQTFFVRDTFTGQNVPGMLQVDASGFTASFVPQTLYAVEHRFQVTISGVLDLTEKLFPASVFFFTTGFNPVTQGPTLVATSPASTATGVPLNSLVLAQFSAPLSVVTATAGFQVLQGNTPVQGAIALSNGNTLVTFTPTFPLSPNTVYTIAATNQITDVAANPLSNPGNFTFVTGPAADNTTPSVTTISPANGVVGVPTNGVIQLQFNKQVDPLTVTTANFVVFPQATGIPILGTVVISANGLTATFTPNPPLDPSTNYSVQATSGIADLQGHPLPFFSSSFATGLGPATTAPTVLQVSPPNGTSGVPVNPQVVVVVSAPVSAVSVSRSSITVSAGGTTVSGTTSLSSDGTTLTFTPTNLLAVSTPYTVTVSGFTDQAGNTVVPFTSTFTTGTAGVANTTNPAITAVSPANGAVGVPTTSAIVLTFNEVIDAATVNINTVPVFSSGSSGQVAGSYAVDMTGRVVMFTPLSPLPGNKVIGLAVQGVTDLSGNRNNFFSSSFTTAAGTDTTTPTVVMVAPGNNTTGIGLNAVVVVTFSKSLNRGTINSNTVGLLVNGTKLAAAINVSADNRVVTLSAGTLPASSTVAVVATGVTDLSGNALSGFESSFTTAAAFDTDHPAVAVQRPGNGATGVPLNTSVVLYVNEAMNAATVQGALHVSQNGVLASGTTQVSDSGQVVVFAPSAPWQNNALIQVFLDGTAQDVDGNSLSTYQGLFRTVPDTSTAAPTVVSTSPANNSFDAPTNGVIDVGFNEPLNPATVNTTTVSLVQNTLGPNTCCSFAVVPSTVSLLNGGTVVRITPNTPLTANNLVEVGISSALQATNGRSFPADPFGSPVLSFSTGASVDTTLPTILSVSPPNGSANVGDNAEIRIVFNKPISPLTVTGTTVQLTGGSTPAVPDSISFGNNNQSVVLVPHAPLPDNTLMTLTISGLTDAVGNPLAPQTTTFTTGTGPDLVAPAVVNQNPSNAAMNLPINAPVILQLNEPIDPGSVNGGTLLIQDKFISQSVAGTYSVSPDGRTISFLPNTPLAIDRNFSVLFNNRGITDLAGNLLSCAGLCDSSFTTGIAANTTEPSVMGVSPVNGLTGVPINSQVVVQFSEPVDALTINQVTLSSAAPVNVTTRLSNANQTLTLVPVVPLTANAMYTINVTGVQDLSGNALTASSTTTFTTGAGADLTPLAVKTVSPANGAVFVPSNAVIQVQFSKRVDPLTVTMADFLVSPQATGLPISGIITVSADGLTATFTPSAPLNPFTNYSVQATGGIVDLEGHPLPSFSSSFTTGLGAVTTAPMVVQVSPANGFSGVPLNPRVVVVASTPVSAASISNTAITVAAGGTSVSGAISLSNDRATLTFVPTNLLVANTLYTVTASGFADQAGNIVTPFTSTFTTSTSVATTTPPTVAVSPANGATGVPTSSAIVLTFNEPIDATTVNVNSVPIRANGFGGQLPGTYGVDATGMTITFTPLSPLPGNTLISVQVTGVSDLSGNNLFEFCECFFASSFTTAAGTDTTVPTVLMVTPNNGATGIGLNAAVVLTFSKSLNRNTINNNTVGLLANGSRLGGGISVSADNRMVTLNAGTLPASSTVTVVATPGVTDLVGNALGNFESSFTTAAAFDTTHPAVVAQRPTNGASAVPLNTSLVLYVNEAMNSATVQGALHVSQNGVLVNGTTQVSESGQVVVFTPSTPFGKNALIQVFLDETAQDVDGNSLSAYQGSFQTVTDTPSIVNVNPASGLTVPTNVVIEIEFNEALDPETVNTGTVSLFQSNSCCPLPVVPITVSLLNGGTVVQVTPNAPLAANTSYQVDTNTSGTQVIQGINGVPFPVNEIVTLFRTGAGPDTVAPAIMLVSPPNGAGGIGDNAEVRVVFSKSINPLSVNGTTIQLTDAGMTAVPDSISFSNNEQTVLLVPHAPMPDNTLMTVVISGVTDIAGNAVVPQTTTFTTGTGPDLVRPKVVNENPFNGASNVPLNAPIMLQASEPIDPGTVNSNTLLIQDNFSFPSLAGNYSLSPDGRTINFLPSLPLAANHTFSVLFDTRGITDLAGNLLGCAALCGYSFTTGTTANTTGPGVLGVSPADGLTGVPINAQVVVQFSEPVDALTVNQVTLSNAAGTVNAISQLSNANQTLTLVPVVPLNTNTKYTVSVTGVQDLSGNPLTASSTTTFTVGAGAVLAPLTVTTASPVNGVGGVPINTAIQAQFSNQLNPLTVTAADFLVLPQATGIPIAGTISVSTDGFTVTFTPNSTLVPSTSYLIEATSSIRDLEGQNLQSFSSNFQTGTTANTTGPSVVGVSPGNGMVGVPTNTQVVIHFSEAVNALTLNQVTLSSGGTVGLITRLSNANQTVTLAPVAALNPSTTYTINVSGVQDLSGNSLTASSITTFTTGAGPNSSSLVVTSVNPATGATAVSTTSAIQLRFSAQVDALTVTTADFQVFRQGSASPILGRVSVSGDGLTATFTPSTALLASSVYFIGAGSNILDLEGHSLQSFSSSFTTGTQ